MWNNIGRRLQALAKVVCWIGIIGSAIWGIVIMTQSNYYQSTILSGLITLVIGCFASWIGSWAMYGLGLVVEYVENGGGSSYSYSGTSAGTVPDSTTADRSSFSYADYWICPNCKTRNPKSKVECKECGKVR